MKPTPKQISILLSISQHLRGLGTEDFDLKTLVVKTDAFCKALGEGYEINLSDQHDLLLGLSDIIDIVRKYK